jgi:hypothetical protein
MFSNGNSFSNGQSMGTGTEKEAPIWRWLGADTRYQR